MTYPEYKTAAERHLVVCWHIAQQAKDYEDKKRARGLAAKEQSQQDFLLADLYYLSGYMLECLYSYAMCKYENIPNNQYVSTVLDNASVGTYTICYSDKKRSRLAVSKSIVRPKHRMTLSELAYFTQNNRFDFATCDIPILNNQTFPDVNNAKFLQYWTAYERYKINNDNAVDFPTFNYTNVTNFFWELVDVCAQISEHILREITLFRRLIKKRP